MKLERMIEKGYEYIILTYFEGKDMGLIDTELANEEKRNIAHEIVAIQKKIEKLKLDNVPADWTWKAEVDEKLTPIQEKAFHFYTLMFCVDFMGERGIQFMDKRIEVNEEIVKRLNTLYDELLKECMNK